MSYTRRHVTFCHIVKETVIDPLNVIIAMIWLDCNS